MSQAQASFEERAHGHSVRFCLVALAAFVYVVAAPSGSGANHLDCNQYDGSDSVNDRFTGTNQCDEFWTYAGIDTVYAHDSVPPTHDELHMGSGTDLANGEAGIDYIYGGDNPTDSREELFGGTELDLIEDLTGPDWDRLCGGPNTDNPLDARDGDGMDTVKGETNDYAHIDSVYGNGSDTVLEDGTCS